MVLQSGRLPITYTDADVTRMIRGDSGAAGEYTSHFTGNEEFFVRLPQPIEVPSFPVHHDLDDPMPHRRLSAAVRSVVGQIHRMNGSLLGGLTHLFDPATNVRPGFFRLYRIDSISFLYLVQLDLTYRPRRGSLVERTTNLETATFRTRDLFLEADLYPLVDTETENGRLRAMTIEQAVSDTWIGETGRGYMRAGMWLDRDLTKFFSRLFVPSDIQTYPYFPFNCKYRAIAHSVVNFDEESRRRSVALLKRARETLLPHLREVEDELRKVQQNGFSESLPTFTRLKREVDARWRKPWEHLSVRRYLNDEDEREFEVKHGLF